ncbi:hypothetical protein KA005_50330 [bacterium]|nr:hypothetical protein [bacterium]
MGQTTHADDDTNLIDPINTKIGENTDAIGTTTLFARLKQIVESYLDAILANQAGEETTGSYNLPNDLVENTVIEITGTKRVKLDSIWLDFVNLLQDVTIKVYHKVDGTNYRQYDTYNWATTEEDGVLIRDVTVNNDWKLTVTSAVAQGGIKAIPYNVIKTPMEA